MNFSADFDLLQVPWLAEMYHILFANDNSNPQFEQPIQAAHYPH
jgi:hypothetical protein